ncbi:ATP-binding protein [Kitasatospora cheerisanensis]|uniref:histidine kinase n=1 Tax=Kitasatospora cheerisanensis KCTC 2395 TaxID=1348663 RepID=A0A066YP09_9ACTN|nr:sensor histidine kinase [Kitasatospora cheerisanensis]KDN81679.1 histidine kinase [Kitasatospora cheerisanensis KCTC 2395]
MHPTSPTTGPARPRRRRSLAGRLFAVQVVIVGAVVAGGSVLAYLFTAGRAEDTARHQVTAVALSLADAPTVREAAAAADPSAVLQPYAQQVRTDTGVDFVTVMDPQGTRWTHPDPAQIGRPFLGHIDQAQQGRLQQETYTGTLGPSVRVVAPVFDDGHHVVALVSAGITVDNISARLRTPLLALVGIAGGALVLGATASYLLAARLRRHTHGMDAGELAHLYDYHQATLHSVREGLVLLDRDHRVLLCNDAARELLQLEDPIRELTVRQLRLPNSLTRALESAEPVRDEVHLTAERVLLLNTSPVGPGLGTVVTLRDHTELQGLTGELDTVKGIASALDAQAHEAANRLHAVVSLIELGRHREAVEFATAELALAQRLTDQVVGAVGEPVLAALLLGKAAQAAERGVELHLTEDSRIDDGVLPDRLTPRDLVTLLGNLIDNAVDAAIENAALAAPEVRVTARTEDGHLLLRVADTGTGVDPAAADEVFRRGWTTKQHGRGLGLALVAQTARRNGGEVHLGDPGFHDGGAVLTVRLPLQRPAVDA